MKITLGNISCPSQRAHKKIKKAKLILALKGKNQVLKFEKFGLKHSKMAPSRNNR